MPTHLPCNLPSSVLLISIRCQLLTSMYYRSMHAQASPRRGREEGSKTAPKFTLCLPSALLCRHSVGLEIPVATPLQGDPIFLQVNMLLPPWDAQQTQGPQDILIHTPNQGFRRLVVS